MVEAAVPHRALLAAALALSACATPPRPRPTPAVNSPFGDPSRRDREAPLVLDAITDTRTGALLSPAELAVKLKSSRLLFFGESHTHPEAHSAQARLLEALATTGRQVLVGLEMFPRDDATDEALNRWSEGAADEETFLRDARWYKHWGYPFGLYRDVFLAARRHKLRLFGVNAPREVITAVRKKGFAALSPEEKAHLPAKVDTTSEEHRRLFRAFFDDAGGGAHGAGMSEAAWDGMFRAQSTWDAVMGWNAVRILEAHGTPDAIMVVLLGSGHVAFGLGATRQIAGAAPAATLITVPVTDDEGLPSRVRASYAEYLWTIPAEPALPLYPTLGVSLSDPPGGGAPTVAMVMPESPAARAGLAPGDVVLALDGAPVTDRETFSRLMAEKRWGDTVRVSIRRAGASRVLEAPLRRTLDTPAR